MPGCSSTVASTPSPDYLFASGLIYFGTATIGPCPRKVVEATMRAWYELESNPTAMGYGTGATLEAAERVRQRAADFLGCSKDEIAITRSTTDGMNAIAQGLRLRRGDRVLTSDQEHDGGSSGWQYIAQHDGVEIDKVRIPPGRINTDEILGSFTETITRNTKVISVSHVLTSTGLRMPISEIAALARKHGILLVVDGAQAVGGIEVNIKSLGCDAYATSGHKWLMAPKGTGLLYISSQAARLIKPIQLHGGCEFYTHSSGVGNLPGVVGLGTALDTLKTVGMRAVEQHNLALRNRFYEGLKQIRRLNVVSPPPGPLATPIVTFTLPTEIDGQSLTATLRDKHQIIVKMVPKVWLNGIRLSPHIFNTEDEVDSVLRVLRAELA
jgi:selenocysteine lyase/cysteine desulfurase